MMTKPTSEQVTFLAAGTGAVQRTALDKFRETVSVKDFGAVGDGVANDTAAIKAAIAASSSVLFPQGTYLITESLEPTGIWKRWHFDNVDIVAPFAGAAILLRNTTDNLAMSGTLRINCQNAANSCGIRLRATAEFTGPCTSSVFDTVQIFNATIGIHMYSDGVNGVFYNTFRTVTCLYCQTAILLQTDNPSLISWVNANMFDSVFIRQCGDGIVVNKGDFNSFNYVEIESLTGTAIKLQRAVGFNMNGGWIEGCAVNIDIADDPLVRGVYITSAIDSSLGVGDAKFIYNSSNQRSVVIQSGEQARWLGVAGFEDQIRVGNRGIPANDQGHAQDGLGRIRVPASMDFFRHSVAAPVFFMRARSGTAGWNFFTVDDGPLLDMRKSTSEFNTPLRLAGHAWNNNQLRLGSYYLWVDGTGDLRIKNGNPSSDIDGTVVGTQT